MAPQRATLLQVAQRAGVSRSTASFVLTGRHLDMRISEDARQRVLRAAQELDYRPNLMARSLRTKVTKTVALVSDTLASDPYAGRAIHGGLAAAVAYGHLLFIGETEGDPVVEERLIDDFLDRQVDAFVYASMFTRYVRLPKQLRGRPVVLLNCLTKTAVPAQHAIIPDELAAGRSAARATATATTSTSTFVTTTTAKASKCRSRSCSSTTTIRRPPASTIFAKPRSASSTASAWCRRRPVSTRTSRPRS